MKTAGSPSPTPATTVPLRGGVLETTGETLSAGQVAQRVTWLTALASGMTAQLLAEHWNPGDLALLAAGVRPDGRKLPASGWMALRRLGWKPTAPDGVYASDRVSRVAGEHAARLLRVALHRDNIVAGVVASWPADPIARTGDEWVEPWAAVPAGTTRAEVRSGPLAPGTFGQRPGYHSAPSHATVQRRRTRTSAAGRLPGPAPRFGPRQLPFQNPNPDVGSAAVRKAPRTGPETAIFVGRACTKPAGTFQIARSGATGPGAVFGAQTGAVRGWRGPYCPGGQRWHRW